MVRALEETIVAVAEAPCRVGVDCALCDDRRIWLADLARGRICRRCADANHLRPSDHFQRRVDATVPSRSGFFVDIVLVWLSIVAMIVLFMPFHIAAASLLLPYLAWVSFAAALDFAVWRLNASAAQD
jgi:hypothetical protein